MNISILMLLDLYFLCACLLPVEEYLVNHACPTEAVVFGMFPIGTPHHTSVQHSSVRQIAAEPKFLSSTVAAVSPEDGAPPPPSLFSLPPSLPPSPVHNPSISNVSHYLCSLHLIFFSCCPLGPQEENNTGAVNQTSKNF